MRILLLLLLLLLEQIVYVVPLQAFGLCAQHRRGLGLCVTSDPRLSTEDSVPTDDAVAQARLLLMQAKRLREQAKVAEDQVHVDLLQKKSSQDADTDEMIRQLFYVDSTELVSPQIAAARIQNKRLSLSCLERIVDRLQYRESEARGEMHVVMDNETFQVKKTHMDSLQVKKLEQLRQRLLDAALLLDQQKQIEHRRWEAGTLQKSLLDRVHYMQREHEAQFLKRQQEFFEAAKRKKHFSQAGGEGFSGLHSIYGKDEKEKDPSE
jgi:hypothetical protein